MLKETIRAIDTAWWPILGLLAFLVAFACVIAYVIRLRKSDVETLKNLPLDDSDELDRQTALINGESR